VSTTAVFFDVDFTLIYPGPTFDGEGYRQFAARHGVNVDPSSFTPAVASASVELDRAQDDIYRPELFIRYARRVLEQMGGDGPGLETCAREIYDEWAACQHFSLYDDVQPVLEQLHAAGLRIGLISNTHRCLASLQSHFELEPYITAALSSSDHGYMKPHPSIFEAALRLLDARPTESVMVGDSLNHDIRGARQVGMNGVLIERSATSDSETLAGVPVIRTLAELPEMLAGL
jgi:putative hydrolase of the HAD superfamily